MSDPFVAEIRMVGFNFAPTGWAQCNGQLMPISQNTALFSLLGTFYGGDGKSTFALPNLEGSAPMHQGQGAGLSDRFLGEQGGSEFVTLIVSEMPAHGHGAVGISHLGTSQTPSNQSWGGNQTARQFNANDPDGNMNVQTLGISGGSLPHNNMPPYLVVNFIIAMQGVFPPRN
jgi:microcystin-dependent protein